MIFLIVILLWLASLGSPVSATDILPPRGAVLNRAGDRLFVGQNTNINDGNTPEITKDWLETLVPYSTSIATVNALSQSGGIGFMGGTRTSDGGAGAFASATDGVCINDITIGTNTTCAAGYFESIHLVGGHGTSWSHGMEIDIDEMNMGTVNGVTFPVSSHPFSTNPNGMTTGLIVASGGARGGANDASTAIRITPNVAKFLTGIEIRGNALTVGGGGFSEAMALPANAILQWYGSDNVANSYLTSTAGPGSATTGIAFGNGGLSLLSSSAASLTLQNTGATINEIFFKTGATVEYVFGTDAGNNLVLYDSTNAVNVLGLNISTHVLSMSEPGGLAILAGGLSVGATGLTKTANEIAIDRAAASGSAPGAAGAKIAVVCGTAGGSAKIIAYAGTSTTPATVLDNIGSGVTGC